MCWISAKKLTFFISQGCEVTYLRWVGYCRMCFIANFIRFPVVLKFWKSVKIWCYREFKGGNFFETQCINNEGSLTSQFLRQCHSMYSNQPPVWPAKNPNDFQQHHQPSQSAATYVIRISDIQQISCCPCHANAWACCTMPCDSSGNYDVPVLSAQYDGINQLGNWFSKNLRLSQDFRKIILSLS